MKFIIPISAIIGTTLAAPPAQTAHLTFRSDPSNAAYTLTIVADGTTSTVHNNTPISLIDAPDYLARSLCKFDTVDKVEFSDTIAADNVTQQVVLKPASVIRSVSCEGMCVGTYGMLKFVKLRRVTDRRRELL